MGNHPRCFKVSSLYFLAKCLGLFDHLIIPSSVHNLLIPYTQVIIGRNLLGVALVEIFCCESFVRIKNYHSWRKYLIKYFVANLTTLK